MQFGEQTKLQLSMTTRRAYLLEERVPTGRYERPVLSEFVGGWETARVNVVLNTALYRPPKKKRARGCKLIVNIWKHHRRRLSP